MQRTQSVERWGLERKTTPLGCLLERVCTCVCEGVEC